MMTLEEFMKLSDEEKAKVHPLVVNAASLAQLAITLNLSVERNDMVLFLKTVKFIGNVNALLQETSKRMIERVTQAGGLNNPNTPIAKA